MMRTSTLTSSWPPTRRKERFSSTRSRLTCTFREVSPSSSRNSEPPSAISNTPLRRPLAEVKLPFSWPNSSLSSRVSVNAPQLTEMSGALLRWLRSWMARATSSLPVPVSPRMRTVASVEATARICSKTRSILGLRVSMWEKPSRSERDSCSRWTSLRARLSSRISATAARRWVGLTGWGWRSRAPARMAETARGTLSRWVVARRGTPRARSANRRTTSAPLRSGSSMLTTSRSGDSSGRRARASRTEVHSTMWRSSAWRARRTRVALASRSSTTTICSADIGQV